MCWVLLWPYHPLPAYCTGSLLSYWVTCRYLTFLAVDWLRTVSASPPFLLLLGLLSLFPLSLLLFLICLSLSGFGPVLGVRAPPFPSLSVPLPPGAFFDCLFASGVFGLPCFASCTCIPGFFLVVCFSWLFVPLGLVPGLSGRRLVQDFQHRPFPVSLIVCVFSSALTICSVITNYYIPRKDSSVVLLAVDWSGVSAGS